MSKMQSVILAVMLAVVTIHQVEAANMLVIRSSCLGVDKGFIESLLTPDPTVCQMFAQDSPLFMKASCALGVVDFFSDANCTVKTASQNTGTCVQTIRFDCEEVSPPFLLSTYYSEPGCNGTVRQAVFEQADICRKHSATRSSSFGPSNSTHLERFDFATSGQCLGTDIAQSLYPPSGFGVCEESTVILAPSFKVVTVSETVFNSDAQTVSVTVGVAMAAMFLCAVFVL